MLLQFRLGSLLNCRSLNKHEPAELFQNTFPHQILMYVHLRYSVNRWIQDSSIDINDIILGAILQKSHCSGEFWQPFGTVLSKFAVELSNNGPELHRERWVCSVFSKFRRSESRDARPWPTNHLIVIWWIWKIKNLNSSLVFIPTAGVSRRVFSSL